MLGEDKAFYRAILISCMIHSFLIGGLSFMKPKIQKSIKEIEVVYQMANPTTTKITKAMEVKDVKVIKDNPLLKDIDILPKEPHMFSPLTKDIKDISKFSGKIPLNRKQVPKIKTMDMDEKVSIPMIRAEKITNPRYLTYNEAIRQRIKQKAYHYVDHPDFETGDVYLTFIITADGTLKQSKIIEEKTHASDYLKGVGLKSVQEADPFPPFPHDLNYPELTFNVVMSFEVKE